MDNHKIILANGTEIPNVTINGNNYNVPSGFQQSVLTRSALTKVTVKDASGKTVDYGENMMLLNFWEENDGIHFILREMTQEEKKSAELEAKLEYLAMMTDIDL